MSKRKIRTFTLPDDVYELLRQNADAERLPMSRFLERMIWSLRGKNSEAADACAKASKGA